MDTETDQLIRLKVACNACYEAHTVVLNASEGKKGIRTAFQLLRAVLRLKTRCSHELVETKRWL